MVNRLRYVITAALLGLGWYAVLLVPPWTRDWLRQDRNWTGIPLNGALLMVTSVVVAWAFRRFIAGAQDFRQHLLRAAVMPYAGCVVYLTLWNAVAWTSDLSHGVRGSVHDSLVIYPWGLAYALIACFVVVPYGLACQYAMSAALAAPADRVSA
jgi:hypothetical protein